MTVAPNTFSSGEQECRDRQGGVILVVDDEDYVRDLIGRILREHGFSVVSARNGEEALSHIARQALRLVVCNICMPRMNGPHLFDCISRISPSLSQRFIFCSGDTASEKSCSFLRSSGQPYLAKPFDVDELVSLVRQWDDKPIVLQREQVEHVLSVLDRLQCGHREVRPVAVPAT